MLVLASIGFGLAFRGERVERTKLEREVTALASEVSSLRRTRDARSAEDAAALEDAIEEERMRRSERDGFEAALFRTEKDRDALRRRLAHSETERIKTEAARRKLVDLVGSMAAEANAARARAGGDADSASEEDPEARLEAVRARIALRERLTHILRRYGRASLRVHALEGVEGSELRGLRLLQLSESGTPDGLYSAARARIEVDRPSGMATIRLFDVTRTMEGVRLPRAEEWQVRFEIEEPRAFVAELGKFCVAKGEWPKPDAVVARTPEDAIADKIWMDRLDSFLEGIDGPERYRLQRVVRVEVPTFFGVEILCMTPKGRLDRRIRAARVEVAVDREAKRVELLLRDGAIESVRGKLELPKSRDYKFRLAGVTPAEADRALLGFVRRR